LDADNYRQQIDIEGAKTFLDTWASKIDFVDASPRSPSDFTDYLATIKDSAPGIDGIPCSGWHASGVSGALTLFEPSSHIMSGSPVPISFTDSITVFPPKSDLPGDITEIIRPPEDTRPLALKTRTTRSLLPLLAAASRM
jgi:hypothetical protein